MLTQSPAEEIEEIFLKVIEQARSVGARSVFLSGEGLGLMDSEQISSLASYCEKYFARRRFIFIARNRQDYLLSSYKHFLRFAPILSEQDFAGSFRFSPKETIKAWKENFSDRCEFILYDEIKKDLINKFFSIVFNIYVDENKKSNVSLDFLTANIYNIFLKEWGSREVAKIIWGVGRRHRAPMSFAVENKVAESLVKACPDEDWKTAEFRGDWSLLADEGPRQTSHDPIQVCDKMIDMFQQLRDHFETLPESQNESHK